MYWHVGREGKNAQGRRNAEAMSDKLKMVWEVRWGGIGEYVTNLQRATEPCKLWFSTFHSFLTGSGLTS